MQQRRCRVRSGQRARLLDRFIEGCFAGWRPFFTVYVRPVLSLKYGCKIMSVSAFIQNGFCGATRKYTCPILIEVVMLRRCVRCLEPLVTADVFDQTPDTVCVS